MTCNTVVDVSFGFPSLIGFTFMSDMIHKFKEVFPKAQVSMYEAQLSSFLPALRDGRLDFAIGTLSNEMQLQDLHVEPLFESGVCHGSQQVPNVHRHHHTGIVKGRTVGVAANEYGLLQRITHHSTTKWHQHRKHC